MRPRYLKYDAIIGKKGKEIEWGKIYIYIYIHTIL